MKKLPNNYRNLPTHKGASKEVIKRADLAAAALVTASLFLEPPNPHRLGDLGLVGIGNAGKGGRFIAKGLCLRHRGMAKTQPSLFSVSAFETPAYGSHSKKQDLHAGPPPSHDPPLWCIRSSAVVDFSWRKPSDIASATRRSTRTHTKKEKSTGIHEQIHSRDATRMRVLRSTNVCYSPRKQTTHLTPPPRGLRDASGALVEEGASPKIDRNSSAGVGDGAAPGLLNARPANGVCCCRLLSVRGRWYCCCCGRRRMSLFRPTGQTQVSGELKGTEGNGREGDKKKNEQPSLNRFPSRRLEDKYDILERNR